jgi:hypothetical protein
MAFFLFLFREEEFTDRAEERGREGGEGIYDFIIVQELQGKTTNTGIITTSLSFLLVFSLCVWLYLN